MATKLAIAISGAVSLGSYEAGVVYEIVNAIAQHNRHNQQNPDAQIHIDVLSGASAGGMTAAILAQKLLFNGESLDHPYNNVLHDAWVKNVDISQLLSDAYADDPTRSLLSSNFIDHMAEDILLSRYHTPSPSNRHLAAGDSVLLGLAMSNLNGIDYAVDAFQNASLSNETGQFVQTRFQDSFTRFLNDESDTRELWQTIKDAARACGAFPAAFAPVKLLRRYQEWDYFGKAKAFAESAFTYVDGGTFNNYPLGTAKRLVDTIDTQPLDYEKRFYLYIAPNSKVSCKQNIDGETSSIFNTSAAISSAIFNQSRFQDWIVTSHYNDLIKQLDHRAETLGEHILGLEETELSAVNKAFDLLLDKIYDDEDERDQKQEREVLSARYSTTTTAQALHSGQYTQAHEVWTKAVQVLEASGRLHDKDHMAIYTVTANSDELASDGLFSFVGFLEQSFREHDYNIGRSKARAFLQNLKDVNLGVTQSDDRHLPLKDFDFAEPLPNIPDLGNASITDVNRTTRQQLFKHSHKRVNLWLKQAKVNWILRKLALTFVDRKVKKFLGL